MSSAFYTGRVMHQRMRPARHRLQYRVFSLLLDVDELPSLAKRLKLFSLNRFNLFSLHERDYGAGDGVGLRAYVDARLQEAGLPTGGAIRLLTMPRILGYAFNPLSVYFCELPRAAGGQKPAGGNGLAAVLYEVHNTFGQRHSYLIEVDTADREREKIVQDCDKNFYVSPFLGLAMHYRFNVTVPADDRPGLAVGITASDADGPILVAHLDAERKTLSDSALALALFTHPLLTLKVVGAIHWEALRLWLKGVRLQPRPEAPQEAVTIIKNDKPMSHP